MAVETTGPLSPMKKGGADQRRPDLPIAHVHEAADVDDDRARISLSVRQQLTMRPTSFSSGALNDLTDESDQFRGRDLLG
jgi:hypothetical protein